MQTEGVAARLEVVSLAVQELIRELTPEQASRVGDALRSRLATVAEGVNDEGIDTAMSSEVLRLLEALGRCGPGRAGGR